MRFCDLILLLLLLATNQSACFAAPSPISAATERAEERTGQFRGKVVSVTDGDTIDVLCNGTAERIRLNGIDCPEKRQAFGSKAKEYVSAQCFDKVVTVKRFGHDRYGRTIGDVILPDGRMLNEELVRNGYAWWFRKYAPENKTLESLEQQAREKKIGLWHDTEPVAPWDFRHNRMSRKAHEVIRTGGSE